MMRTFVCYGFGTTGRGTVGDGWRAKTIDCRLARAHRVGIGEGGCVVYNDDDDVGRWWPLADRR